MNFPLLEPWWAGGTLWPVTIIVTRYGGSYEGGKWAAFHLEHPAIPEDATGGDTECMLFWERHRTSWWVATGSSADEAYSRLEYRCRAEHARRKGTE